MWAWMSTPPGITTMPRASIRARVRGHVVDDLAVAQADVAHLAGHAVGRVVDAPAGDAQHHAAPPAPRDPLGDRREHLLVARARGREQRAERDGHAVEPVHDAGPVHARRGGRERDARGAGRRRVAGVDRHDGDRAQALGGRRRQVLERIGADDERRVGVAALEHRRRAQLAGLERGWPRREADGRRVAGLPGEHVLGAGGVRLVAEHQRRRRA